MASESLRITPSAAAPTSTTYRCAAFAPREPAYTGKTASMPGAYIEEYSLRVENAGGLIVGNSYLYAPRCLREPPLIRQQIGD